MSSLTNNFVYQEMIDVLSNKKINFQEAMKLINSADLDFLADCANQITVKFGGDKVDVETLVNAKSGRCPEDCSFCSQSTFNTTKIEKYPLLTPERILAQAEEAKNNGANSFCIVCAYRSPPEQDFIQICMGAGITLFTSAILILGALIEHLGWFGDGRNLDLARVAGIALVIGGTWLVVRG